MESDLRHFIEECDLLQVWLIAAGLGRCTRIYLMAIEFVGLPGFTRFCVFWVIYAGDA
jgi:hypothetical protein